MKKIIHFLLYTVLLSSSVTAQIDLEHTTGDEAVRIERFSFARVSAARQMFARRMRKTRLATTAVIGSLGAMVVGGIGYKMYGSYQKGKAETEKAKLGEREALDVNGVQGSGGEGVVTIEDVLNVPTTTTRGLWAKAAKLPKPVLSGSAQEKKVKQREYDQIRQSVLDQIEGLASSSSDATTATKKPWSMWDNIIWAPVMLGLTVGIAGLVFTTGQHALRVVSGTLEEALNLWAHGYKYWYNSLAERVQATFNNLRESLIQARKIAQSSYDPGVLTRHVQRLSSGAVVSTHYRADIITMYQVGLGMLERLIAVMYLRAPEEQHVALHNQAIKLSHKINAFANRLERDLNEGTHGFLTDYQDSTLEKYHAAFEEVQILLAANNAMYLVK